MTGMDIVYSLKGRLKHKKYFSISESAAAWMFVIPGIFFTIMLKYYPIIKGFYISLFTYDLANPPGKFVGLENFKTILSSQDYWQAWGNTLYYLVLFVLMSLFVPCIQAIFLNEIFKFRNLFSTIYLIPMMIPTTVTVILWKYIWNPEYGIANMITEKLGLGTFAWLSDPHLNKFCISFPNIVGGGVGVLLFLAAILGISTEIYESAMIDGCTGWKKLFYITLPNIKYLFFIQLILTVIGSMQIINEPLQYTSGGPAGSSTSMGYYIYKLAIGDASYLRMDQASAAGIVLFIVIFIMTVIQLLLTKSERD